MRISFHCRWLLWLFILLGAIPAFLLCNSRAEAGVQQPGGLRLIAPAEIASGQPFTVTLVLDAPNSIIAAYETTLSFDTAAMHVRAVEPAPTLAGQSFLPLGPVETASAVAFGAYRCLDPACDRSEVNGVATPSEVLPLATLTLVGDKPGSIELLFDHTLVVDKQGVSLSIPEGALSFTVSVGSATEHRFSIPATAINARQTRDVSSSLETALDTASPDMASLDMTGNGVIDVQDVSEIVLAWAFSRAQGQRCSVAKTRLPDLNGDGCLDVLDLQRMMELTSANSSSPRQAPAVAAGDSLLMVVNTIGDKPDANPGDGLCATATGVCSLRAAIDEANAHPGPDTIHFALPGDGIQTIQLTSALPALNDLTGGATIDGYSQPGAQANSDPWISNAMIRVQIRGGGYSAFNGLTITSPHNVIRGMALFEFYQSIHLYGTNAHDNLIAGNFIGTDAQGLSFSATDTDLGIGVILEQGAAHNLIGTPALADRNVISGSGSKGVALFHAGTNENIIRNNIIGLNPTGTARLPNFRHGVDVNFDASNNVIGGANANEYNVISGNGWSGVELSHGLHTTGNQIISNFIGTNITGTRATAYTGNGSAAITLKDGVIANTVAGNIIGGNPAGGVSITGIGTERNAVYNNRIGISLDGSAIPNSDFGVEMRAGSTHSRIGPHNLIVNNDVGVLLLNDDTIFNTITQNSIYANSTLGIDLDPVGVNISISKRITGANQLLDAPTLLTLTHGVVSGSACVTCTIEFFRDTRGVSSSAQGKTFITSAAVSAEGSFRVIISNILQGEYVTATATDAAGNTSEFSLPLQAAEQIGSALYLPTLTRQP